MLKILRPFWNTASLICYDAPVKKGYRNNTFPTNGIYLIGCNDYLAYRTIFLRVMFCPKIKLDVFFPARKAVDELLKSDTRKISGNRKIVSLDLSI